MDNKKLQELKSNAAAELADRMIWAQEDLEDIDPRLVEYLAHLHTNEEVHNVWEILGACRFLRIFRQYPFNTHKVKKIIRLYEGEWKDGRHIQGGLMFSGLRGRSYYQLTPIQVFMLAGVYGPHHWVNTEARVGTRDLLPTERECDDGYIYDLRRLTTEAVFFIPRKFGKTTLGAFFQFVGFFFEDYNYEGYCCANSSDQAKILYSMAYDLIHQMDPEELRIRFTATEINWKKGQPRAAKIVALSAGGKTKDGLFAQYCSSDEYGSAGYVKDHSDMASLINVVEGSMGPRREPLTIHTTTAGNVSVGPFQIKLDSIKNLLMEEIPKF